ncbi:MAG: phytanoyl-CoA dioxygenase family protein [Pseudomonadota bacterium]|jgi:ectoine hydroxylase-related dioxygenase (phytanoyl-CoA dioxygenase family)
MTQHRIERQEDLARDLAGTHKAVSRDVQINPKLTDADYRALMQNGYVILERLIDADALDAIRAACAPHLARTGRNNFEGLKTQRVYDVLSKTGALDRLADHPRVLALLDRIFLPNYLLSQMQVINILPGEAAQPLHYDDAFYQFPRPRPPMGAATVWAIDAFSAENGATVVIPASHLWGNDRQAAVGDTISVAMPAGSAVFFLGTLWHGGGANRSDAARLAVTCQYCQPYLRQQENFLLELDRPRAASLSPMLQSMIGYSIFGPFMGMVNGEHPKRLLTKATAAQ